MIDAGKVTVAGADIETVTGNVVTIQLKLTLVALLALSRTVIPTLKLPAVLAVPEISPVALMPRPVGKPVAVKVSALPSGSDATICRLTAALMAVDWAAGVLTLGGRFAIAG